MTGWTHAEAKTHSLVERLRERCATYGGGSCSDRDVPREDWCERCLAAYLLEGLRDTTPPPQGL